MKTEWTAERNTLALLIPSKHKTAVKDIVARTGQHATERSPREHETVEWYADRIR